MDKISAWLGRWVGFYLLNQTCALFLMHILQQMKSTRKSSKSFDFCETFGAVVNLKTYFHLPNTMTL